jgi:hypothetical protein
MAFPLVFGAAMRVVGGRSLGAAFLGGGEPVVARVRVKSYRKEVEKDIRLTMTQRLKLAGQITRDQIVRNISRPVRKYKGPRSGRIQVDPASRSKPGEFPKADTTRLRKDIFWELRGKETVIVGTTLDYGAILETRMDRSFLRRTVRESERMITNMLVGRLPSSPKFKRDTSEGGGGRGKGWRKGLKGSALGK